MNKTLTNKELVNIINDLVAFIEKDKIAPGKISYAITRNYKTLEQAIEPLKVEQQKISKKIEEANADESLSGEEKQKIVDDMNAAFGDILSTEVDVNIRMVSEDAVSELEGVTVKDYLALDFMIGEASTADEIHPVPAPVE